MWPATERVDERSKVRVSQRSASTTASAYLNLMTLAVGTEHRLHWRKCRSRYIGYPDSYLSGHANFISINFLPMLCTYGAIGKQSSTASCLPLKALILRVNLELLWTLRKSNHPQLLTFDSRLLTLILDVAGRFELPLGVLQTPTYPLGHATLKKLFNHLPGDKRSSTLSFSA